MYLALHVYIDHFGFVFISEGPSPRLIGLGHSLWVHVLILWGGPVDPEMNQEEQTKDANSASAALSIRTGLRLMQR